MGLVAGHKVADSLIGYRTAVDHSLAVHMDDHSLIAHIADTRQSAYIADHYTGQRIEVGEHSHYMACDSADHYTDWRVEVEEHIHHMIGLACDSDQADRDHHCVWMTQSEGLGEEQKV